MKDFPPGHFEPLVNLPSFNERLEALEHKLDSLINKLDLIFGPYVLIKGRFIDNTDKGS